MTILLLGDSGMNEQTTAIQVNTNAKIVMATVLVLIEIAVEATLISIGTDRSVVMLLAVLAVDLLLLSPLKIGRALWYDTVCNEPQKATFSLFFRFYRHRYLCAVNWRIRLWTRMLFQAVVYAWPIAALNAVSAVYAGNETVVFWCGLFRRLLLFFAVVLIALGFIRYRTSSVFLLYVTNVDDAFWYSSRFFKVKREAAWQPYVQLWRQVPLFLLIVPLFYCCFTFHCQTAENIRTFVAEIQKECASPLETKPKT